MTTKTKNILLAIGFVFVLFLCYKLAISRTLLLKNEYRHLKKEEQLYKNIPKQLSLLKQKQKYYDSLLDRFQVKGSSIQNNLLRTINTIGNQSNLKVLGFLEPHVIKNDELTVKTYQFTVEGDFNSILKLIHYLEQRTKFGEIINLHFEKKTNFRTGRDYLQTTVLLKSFGQSQ